MGRKNKCLTCRHNRALGAGGDMDCEYACVGVEETDGAGSIDYNYCGLME